MQTVAQNSGINSGDKFRQIKMAEWIELNQHRLPPYLNLSFIDS